MTQTKNPLVRLRNYVRDSFEESKKITWPTRKETVRYSALVIGITLLVAAFFGVLDYLFTALLKMLI
ncbi:TPA: preprotein translocase subunit SecE [Candidatus Uhrbacteria bacterium]|nr:preprotein translocase subunit SecE [Candidatus Uhrbacteria bacterium]